MIITPHYIKGLTDEQRIQCIRDYEVLHKHGAIGECLLRRLAEDYMFAHGMTSISIVTVMDHMAQECYQFFAYKYMENLNG